MRRGINIVKRPRQGIVFRHRPIQAAVSEAVKVEDKPLESAAPKGVVEEIVSQIKEEEPKEEPKKESKKALKTKEDNIEV